MVRARRCLLYVRTTSVAIFLAMFVMRCLRLPSAVSAVCLKFPVSRCHAADIYEFAALLEDSSSTTAVRRLPKVRRLVLAIGGGGHRKEHPNASFANIFVF